MKSIHALFIDSIANMIMLKKVYHGTIGIRQAGSFYPILFGLFAFCTF